MERKKAEKVINDLAEEANRFLDTNLYISSFTVWREKAIRHISLVFSPDSPQVKTLEQAEYFKPGAAPFNRFDTISQLQIPDIVCRFSETLESLLGDLDFLDSGENVKETSPQKPQKIFVSHSSKDKAIVSEIVNFLSLIGMHDHSIFCTSLEGYGIPLGENWIETLKSEVSSEVIVLFVLSENYFQSAVSLCEMGAAWVLSKKHIPLLIPPLDYGDIKGVIPVTHGFKVNEKHNWTQLKSQLEVLFNLSPKIPQIWENRRDEILVRIDNLLK